jgi:molybdate-binding protein/DNA-binding transcriptional regulator YhcF (GntR family)
MAESILYRKIAETIRRDILEGRLNPGDRLPAVRELAESWDCTPGTIQRAYQELARQGLVSGQAGRGTRVVERLPEGLTNLTTLRRIDLAHRAEGFLLESVTSGYSVEQVETAMQQAMDRWRTLESRPLQPDEENLRFVGSHDLMITWLASHFPEVVPGWALQLRFAGGLGGSPGRRPGRPAAAVWDEENDTYNESFVRRVLPGRASLTWRTGDLADRARAIRQASGLDDLARPGLLQPPAGSGTRVWLDLALRKAGLQPDQIERFSDEKATHTAVARAIAEGEADAGLGLEAAARSYGLDFLFLAYDRYDLVVPVDTMDRQPVRALVAWLGDSQTRTVIESLGGYETRETGHVRWVD